MNFKGILSSRGFWVIVGFSCIAGGVIGVVAGTAGIPWALALSVGFLGTLLAAVCAVLRSALSLTTSGVAGLRKLALAHRTQVQERSSELQAALSELTDTELARHGELLQVLAQSRSKSTEEFLLLHQESERGREVHAEHFRSLDRRVRTVNSQLRDIVSQVSEMEDEIKRIVAATSRANSESMAADVHRTLRGTRALERSMAETGDMEDRISRTFRDEARAVEKLQKEIEAQKKILAELLLSTDFRS